MTRRNSHDLEQDDFFEDDPEDSDSTEEHEDTEIQRSSEPADWHVVIEKKGFILDCKYHSHSIARGMEQLYTRSGYKVTVTHAPDRLIVQKSKTTHLIKHEDHTSFSDADVPAQLEAQGPSPRDFEQSVCRIIRRCRIAEKWTCQELVEKIKERGLTEALNVKSGSGYSRLETGNVKLTLQQIFALAQLFEISPSELFKMAERSYLLPSERS